MGGGNARRGGAGGEPRLPGGLQRCGGAIVTQHESSKGQAVEVGCEQCGDTASGIAREDLMGGAAVGRCGRIVGAA